MKKSYKDLYIWQASVELAVRVLEITREFPQPRRHGLMDQMQRAAVSVASNIAEGKGRLSARELRQFLAVARGSVFELDTQLEIAVRAKLIDPATRSDLGHRANQIGAGINNLLKRLSC